MQKFKDYVAGWLDSSLYDFLQNLPRSFESTKYALVTCIDSNLDPCSLLDKSPELKDLAREALPLEKGLVIPTERLLDTNSRSQLFFGFDEVWFFPSAPSEPKPDSAWLVGPSRIDQRTFDALGEWMSSSSCSLGLGDGEGLNFVVKAHGLVKHLLGHSLNQQPPTMADYAGPSPLLESSGKIV